MTRADSIKHRQTLRSDMATSSKPGDAAGAEVEAPAAGPGPILTSALERLAPELLAAVAEGLGTNDKLAFAATAR